MGDVVILPPHGLWAEWTSPPDPAEPDREETFRILAERGYRHIRMDPNGWPWNPFAKRHPVLRAIDPVRALRVLVAMRRAAVVLCFFESSALIVLLLRRMCLFRGKVVVFDVGVGGDWRLRKMILRLVLPRADRLLPLGRAQVAGLLALGARPTTVQPVLTATYPAFFADTPDCPDGYILAIGDDVSRDYATFIEAVRDLDRDVVIRSGMSLPNAAGTTNVKQLRASTTTQQYKELIAGAAIVVLPLHPSIHAGGISSLLEAMSSGKAVIVTESPGIAEYAHDGTTCRVVAAGDPAALGAAIVALLADGTTRRALGCNARRFILEKCSPHALAAQFADVFDALSAPLSERSVCV